MQSPGLARLPGAESGAAGEAPAPAEAHDGPQPAPTEGEGGSGIIITSLAILPAGAILDEAALARAVGVSTRTIRRMVARYELPPAVSFGGKAMWQAGAVLEWFKARADRAAQAASRRALAFAQHPVKNPEFSS
jgi:predicted DNA-binding transcriptional regulator AlpA